MNVLISLGFRTPDLPHPLEDLGYTLDRIGMTAVFRDGKAVQPDLSFKSHQRNRLLLVEAKGGGVDEEQASKYRQLTPGLVASQNLTSLTANDLKVETCFACTDANKSKVVGNKIVRQLGFPVVVCDKNWLRRDSSTSKFQDGDLEKLFSGGINLVREPSYTYFPFGEGDKKSWIAYHILAALSELDANGRHRFTVKDLVKKSHTLFEYMSNKMKVYAQRFAADVLDWLDERESDRLIVKRHKNQEWEVVRFVRNKQMAEYLSELADEFDRKSTPADYADMTQFTDQSSSVQIS